MANHKSVIVVQKPNEKIAATYVKILCKDFPSYFGVAAIEKGKLVCTSVKGAPKPEHFDEVSKALGDNHIIFTVGKAGNELLEEDIQPFPLLRDKDGNVIVVGLFDGNFEGYSVVKSTHINEYHLVSEVLIPKMKKLYRLVGEDIPKLIEELKDPVTASDFNNMWTDRGNITLFTAEGAPITFSGGNKVREGMFNWGWTSDAFNYKEQTVAKEEKPVEKPMSMLERLHLKAKGGIPAEAAPAEVDPPIVEKKTDTSAAAIAAVLQEYEDVRLPPEAKDWVNKKKIDWWVTELGYKPEGYKELRTVCKRRKGTKMGMLHPLMAQKAKDEAIAAGAASSIKEEKVSEPEKVKDTSVHHNVTAAYMPIMSPKQKIGVKTSWLKDAEVVKVLGDNFQASIDPKLLKEFEDTHATFWDGLGMEEPWLSYEALVKLGETDVRALAIFCFNKQNEAKKNDIKIKSIYADPKNNLRVVA